MTDFTITDTSIHRTPTQTTHGDIHVHGSTLTARRHQTAHEVVIDGSGASVIPLLVATVFAAADRPNRTPST